MSFAGLILKKEWSELEDAWTSHALDGGGPKPALEAVHVAARRKELPRILPLVRDHADVLVDNGKAAEAAELLGSSLVAGGSPGELAKPLFEAATAAWGSEDYWEAYCEIADFRENSPDMRGAWRSLRKLLALEEGRIVYHAKGWGLGRIEELDPEAREARVRFLTGRSDRFPFTSAVDIFEMLAPEDLRCLVVNDPDELKRLVKEEPLEILRWVCNKGGGKVNHPAIKLACGTLGIDGPRFTTFWRKCTKLAEESEWFELSGPTTKRVVRLLDTAEDPGVALKRQLLRSRDLGEALTRARSIVGGEGTSESVRAAALESLEELVGNDEAPLPQRLAAWIFLREVHGETPPDLRATLEAAHSQPDPADPSITPALWATFGLVPGLRDQERCIELLRELAPENWLDEAARNLPHAPGGMVRGLVDALAEAGRTDELVDHYAMLLARPTRNPGLLVRLAEKIEHGTEEERLLPPPQRAQCLLQLAVHLHRATASATEQVRARNRLSGLLTSGSPPLLRRLLDGSSLETIRNLASMLESGIDRAVDRLFTQIAIEISPDVFRGDERPFWELPGTWTTRPGLAAREEELRILKDVKIPANSEAIGKAASFGDLSENSEWEAAIEEQRHLTQKAMELEEAVRGAHLIETAVLPADTVAPGTRVRYRQVGEDADSEIEILGPWDADGDKRISYRSPLAAGMLGCKPGDTVTIELPSETIEVRVQAVAPLELGS